MNVLITRFQLPMQIPQNHPDYAFQVHDVAYRQAGQRTLGALIYQPRGEGPFPAVVCVHGGAWVSGDRSATQGFAEKLAARGIVVMAIDFRMAPLDRYPTSLVDINYAIRWLKQHAADYALDPASVGGVGVSSGGHLILLSAMRPFDPRYHAAALHDDGKVDDEQVDATLAFVVTCSGVLDPLARYRMAQAAGHADILACHKAYFENDEVMAEASPPLILERHEPVQLPPLLMFQGGADPRLPPDTAQRMAELYAAAGGQARAAVFPRMGHAIGDWGWVEMTDLLEQLTAFVGSALSCTKPGQG